MLYYFSCRLVITIVMVTGAYVVFLVILSYAKGETTDCKSQSIQPATQSHTCETLKYINIPVTERHRCSLACIRTEDCRATVYDNRHSVCTLLPQPCMLLRPRPDHVYQSFVQPCFKWTSTCSKCASNYWMIEESDVKTYIARMYHNDDLLVGKLTNKFYAITLDGQTKTSLNDYEELVVDPPCTVNWVWFDANNEQLPPEGALIGGFAAATRTPLYVSRLDISGRHVVGYYNPLDNTAWGFWSGAASRTTFELLVIDPTYVIVWYASNGRNGINALN